MSQILHSPELVEGMKEGDMVRTYLTTA